MKKLVVFAAITMLASPAIAADAIVSAPEPAAVEYAPVFNWSGAYIGAHAGYGWGKSHDINNPDASEQKTKGALGGLQAGYNWQFDNNVVLGAEADVTFSGVKKNWGGAHQHDPYYGSDKIGTNGTVRARLGYAADRFLPYVTGGYAWAETKYKLGCDEGRVGLTYGNCYQNDSFESSSKKTVSGWVAGAGVEYAVTDNWTIKGEFLHKNFGKNKVSLIDPNIVNNPAKAHLNTRNFKTSVNEVRVGVNYKF